MLTDIVPVVIATAFPVAASVLSAIAKWQAERAGRSLKIQLAGKEIKLEAKTVDEETIRKALEIARGPERGTSSTPPPTPAGEIAKRPPIEIREIAPPPGPIPQPAAPNAGFSRHQPLVLPPRVELNRQDTRFLQGDDDLKADVRLPEIEATLAQEESRNTLYRYAAGCLVAGQFVVGGLLASSFVADNLSRSLVGALGLLVLGSSLVNHHFRPDLLHKAAAARVTALRKLKRALEDELWEIRRGKSADFEERIAAVRKKATSVLDDVDASELAFIEEAQKAQRADSKADKKKRTAKAI